MLVHLRAGSGAEMHACRVSTWHVPRQPQRAAMYPSISTVRPPIPTNSDGGMTRSMSVGRAGRQAVITVPCRLVSGFGEGSSPPPTPRGSSRGNLI